MCTCAPESLTIMPVLSPPHVPNAMWVPADSTESPEQVVETHSRAAVTESATSREITGRTIGIRVSISSIRNVVHSVGATHAPVASTQHPPAYHPPGAE